MPRLAVFSLVVFALALAAAVVSFTRGSLLGIVWIMMAGVASNMTWYYMRKAKVERAAAASSPGAGGITG